MTTARIAVAAAFPVAICLAGSASAETRCYFDRQGLGGDTYSVADIGLTVAMEGDLASVEMDGEDERLTGRGNEMGEGRVLYNVSDSSLSTVIMMNINGNGVADMMLTTTEGTGLYFGECDVEDAE